MVGRRDIASWLGGPGSTSERPVPGFPGERLGRPESGSGSVARPGRRLVGICIDWALVSLVAFTLLAPLGRSAGPLVVLLVEHTLLIATAGCSVGHRAVGLRVETLDGGPPGLGRAAVRSLLLCLALPALVWDADQRGLHDKAAGTVLVHT